MQLAEAFYKSRAFLTWWQLQQFLRIRQKQLPVTPASDDLPVLREKLLQCEQAYSGKVAAANAALREAGVRRELQSFRILLFLFV